MDDSAINLEKSGGTAWNSFILIFQLLSLKCPRHVQAEMLRRRFKRSGIQRRNPVGVRFGSNGGGESAQVYVIEILGE